MAGDDVEDGSVRFKDFTLKRPSIKFRIGDENFDATASLTIPLLQQLTTLTTGLSGTEDSDLSALSHKFNMLIDLCNVILVPESAERFKKIAPQLDLREQIMPLLFWLLEAYGLRPTEVSSLSPNSSPNENDGTISTDGALAEISSLMTSPQTLS